MFGSSGGSKRKGEEVVSGSSDSEGLAIDEHGDMIGEGGAVLVNRHLHMKAE